MKRCRAVIAVICSVAVWLCFFPVGCADDTTQKHILIAEDTVTVLSPSRTTQWGLSVRDGQLCYEITRNGNTVVRSSPLGLTVDGIAFGRLKSTAELGRITASKRTDVRKLLGKTAVADDPCIAVSVPVNGEAAFSLEARVFDNGVAFRFILPTNGDRVLNSEETTFLFPQGSRMFAAEAHRYYESIYTEQNTAHPSDTLLGTPATVALADGSYVAVLEGDLKAYPGMKLSQNGANAYTAAFEAASHKLTGSITTPWRILALGNDLNELVNNTIVYQVCDKADSDLFGDDWVKPGRAAWSWITGRTTDRVTPALMEEYTTYAAKLGFEYNIIDEGWIHWANYTDTLPTLAALGESYNIGQILWTGVTAGESFKGGIHSVEDAYAFIDLLARCNMAGGKIDFFPTEDSVTMGVDIYRDILRYAAEKKLVINFHGCNKPSGYDVTFPNELNREAILGLESTNLYNRVTQAQMFTTQPFVRGLTGHADFTPAAEDAFHMAQLVLTDAPLQAIGSHPADLLASPALETVKSIPTVWQETVVLPPSDIAQSAVIARKGNSGSWYVGGINNARAGDEVILDLSQFLGNGTYGYELWTDGDNGLEKATGTVTKADTLTVPFSPYSGFIIRFDRVTLSQYGGEINPDVPVSVAVHDADTEIAYTLDGSNGPLAQGTLQNGDTLSLAESCTLTLTITSGEDKGLCETYRFNRIEK